MKKEIPKVQVVKNERINLSIWLVPIIALLISLWLAYSYFSQLGPEITIEFETSAGLKANQSPVKFRDVPIGVVKKISLKPGGKGVIVTASMNKDAKQFLNTNAKFWIVKPKIDKSGITGLETLVSGSYIELYSEVGGSYREKFIGLKEPYLNEENIRGRYFKLIASSSYDLEVGSLIYCRNIAVGEVKQVKLAKDGRRVEFDIFIKEPYHNLINEQTKFWNISKVNVSLNSNKLDISFASTSQLIYGGIAFSSPTQQTTTSSTKRQYVYKLFSSLSEARQNRIGFALNNTRLFQMYFDQSVGKLDIGAPVKFFDLQIGQVVDINSWFDSKNQTINSVVIAEIDLSIFGKDKNESRENFKDALDSGLVATLAQSNFLLDSLYINLIYAKDKSPQKIAISKAYDVFPTKSVKFANINKKITILLNSLTKLLNSNKQSLHDILINLNSTIKNLNSITSQNDLNNLPKQINSSLLELQKTLQATQQMITSSTKTKDDLEETMKDVAKASKALERVLYKIDQKPNSLIFGD